MPAEETLPSHRQLLTWLVDALSQCQPPADDANSLPCTAAATDRRHLLLTLHVLFPGLVLPALDLLDRGLIRRLTFASGPGAAGPVGNVYGLETDRLVRSSTAADNANQPEGNTTVLPARHTYIVRSLGSTMTRRGRDSKASSKTYVVHLAAWNCSCANFALDAFPSQADPPSSLTGQDLEAAPELFFGGLSTDGLVSSSEGVPCCKHLLACLLAERLGGAVSGQVDQQSTSKEELAAAVA